MGANPIMPEVPSQWRTTWDRAKNRELYSTPGSATGPGGILLLHGFTGSPGELRPLGEWLNDMGYAVEIPVLAGHCTRVEDLNRVRYRDWLISGEQAYDRLSKRTKKVWVIGHSMGGLVGMHLVNRYPVQGIVTNCAPVHLYHPHSWLTHFVGWAIPVVQGPPLKQDFFEPFLGGYNALAVKAASQFLRLLRRSRDEIEQLRSPLLVQQARLDQTVRADSGQYIYEHAASVDKRLKWYEQSGHMLPLDVEYEAVWTDILHFLQDTERGSAG